MDLTLGFSPCPNDCFVFDALVHGKVDTEGLSFNVVMEDVEALNQRAFREELDITKLSYHAYAFLTGRYVLMDAGSALGHNCGPLLISKRELKPSDFGDSRLKIAIPGKYTTANFLLSLAFPEATNKAEMLFSGIEDAVLHEKADAGLIIHENRFTYEQKGLKKVMDLGEFWEALIKAPIPLGGIVAKRALPDDVKQAVNRIIRKSVVYAFANPKSSLPYVKAHAQEMSEEVMYRHIDLYVNQYSVDLGDDGRKAVKLLFTKAREQGVIPEVEQEIFLL
jgi:1,4-dihydroxy-6-naphthoate synthase